MVYGSFNIVSVNMAENMRAWSLSVYFQNHKQIMCSILKHERVAHGDNNKCQSGLWLKKKKLWSNPVDQDFCSLKSFSSLLLLSQVSLSLSSNFVFQFIIFSNNAPLIASHGYRGSGDLCKNKAWTWAQRMPFKSPNKHQFWACEWRRHVSLARHHNRPCGHPYWRWSLPSLNPIPHWLPFQSSKSTVPNSGI